MSAPLLKVIIEEWELLESWDEHTCKQDEFLTTIQHVPLHSHWFWHVLAADQKTTCFLHGGSLGHQTGQLIIQFSCGGHLECRQPTKEHAMLAGHKNENYEKSTSSYPPCPDRCLNQTFLVHFILIPLPPVSISIDFLIQFFCQKNSPCSTRAYSIFGLW